MNESNILLQLLPYLLTPITAIVTWFASKRKRNNDALNYLQETIDLLLKKNNELIQEVTELRNQNSTLKAATESMRLQIEKLTAVAEEKNKTKSSPQKRKTIASIKKTRNKLNNI